MTNKVEWAGSTTCRVDSDTMSLYVSGDETGYAQTGTVRIKYGNLTLQTITVSLTLETQIVWEVTVKTFLKRVDIQPTKAWFDTAGIISYEEMEVYAEFTTGYTVRTADEKLVTGNVNSMCPAVSDLEYEAVNLPAVEANFPGMIIKSVSRLKFAATVTRRTASPLSAVYLVQEGVPSVLMTYNSTTEKYEGSTTGPIPEETTYKIRAIDQRNYAGVLGQKVTPLNYTKPSAAIDSFNTWRCTSAGVKTVGGPYVRVKASCTYDSELDGNELTRFGFYVTEDGAANFHNLTSGTQSSAVEILSRQESESITITVLVEDLVGTVVTRTLKLPGSMRNLVMHRTNSGTFLGIGTSPDYSGGPFGFHSGIDLPAKGAYLVEGIPFDAAHQMYRVDASGFNQDLLNVNFNNRYADENMTAFFTKLAYASGWSNIPSTIASSATFSGIRFVIRANATTAIVIILEITPQAGRIWSHEVSTSGGVGAWHYNASNGV